MTMPSTAIKSGPYVGNGVATSFAYGFKIFTSADLRVVHTDSAGLETDLVLGVDYSVTGVGDSSGSITYPLSGSPLASPETLTLISAIDIEQTTNLSNQGGFFPEVHETVFDRLCRMIQQLSEQLSRAVKTDVSSTITPDDLLASIETSESNAADSAAAALVSENNAAASYDSFDDRYLGAKASAPSVDNDGNALIVGALYWNTTTNNFWIWSGSAWFDPTATAASSAAAVAVADSGGYYVGSDVEAALQEVGAEFVALPSKTEALANKTLTDSVIITAGTPQASTSGTSITFSIIPSWVKRITVMFNGVSQTGSSGFKMLLGDSGGLETTGYACTASTIRGTATNTQNITSHIPLSWATTPAYAYDGVVSTLSLLDASTNTWAHTGTVTDGNAEISITGGTKSLSGTLTQLEISMVSTGDFDAGKINILYEG